MRVRTKQANSIRNPIDMSINPHIELKKPTYNSNDFFDVKPSKNGYFTKVLQIHYGIKIMSAHNKKETLTMKSKSFHINNFTDESNSDYPIDGCNHLVSTSLRDLNSQYKNLMAKQREKNDLEDRALVPPGNGTRSNSKES